MLAQNELCPIQALAGWKKRPSASRGGELVGACTKDGVGLNFAQQITPDFGVFAVRGADPLIAFRNIGRAIRGCSG